MSAKSTTAGVGFNIAVTNVDYIDDFNTRQNIKKRISNILYLDNPPPDSVLLAYVGSQEVNAQNCLFIGDRSDRLYPNSRDNTQSEFIYNYFPVSVQHKNVLVTKKFATSSATDIPLYFKHILDSTIQINTIKLLDKNFEELDDDRFLVEEVLEYDDTTGYPVEPEVINSIAVYNNLENHFDETNGEYDVHYIQYRDASNNTLTVLLNNELAYSEATAEDLWSATGLLAPWSTAYIISGSDSYQLYVPPSLNGEDIKFAVKYTAESKIYVEHPVDTNSVSLWFPRVANGSFSWSYNGIGYTYDIPEFINQSFNPIEPYKLAVRAKSNKINDHLVKLSHEDIATGGLFQYFSMLIQKDGLVEYALTQDPSLVGSKYTDFDGSYVTNSEGNVVEWSSDEIVSVDSRSGIVQLSLLVRDYWEYFSTYNYKEKFYELSSVGMNPIYNTEAHKQIRPIYVVPKSQAIGNSGTQIGSLNNLIVGPNGVITYTSQNGLADGDPLLSQDFNTKVYDQDGSKIYGHIGLHYNWRASTYITTGCTVGQSESITVESTSSFPREGWIRIKDDSGYWRYTKYNNKTKTSFVLSDDSEEVPLDTDITFDSNNPSIVELVNFIDEYSTSSTRLPDNEDSAYSGTGRPNSYQRYFVLANITVNPPHDANQATILDVRQDGGGIDPDKYENAKSIQPETQWYYDYIKYNGQPYPGNSAVVIKLPVELLNTFTEEQIQEIINNNIPFGVKPLIRYYGYKPRILSIRAIDELGFGENYFGDHHFGE